MGKAPDRLLAGYRLMAADVSHEAEAVEWAEGLVADAANAEPPTAGGRLRSVSGEARLRPSFER
jgi:hypothetical protein